jgi:hypothetical protein
MNPKRQRLSKIIGTRRFLAAIEQNGGAIEQQ